MERGEVCLLDRFLLHIITGKIGRVYMRSSQMVLIGMLSLLSLESCGDLLPSGKSDALLEASTNLSREVLLEMQAAERYFNVNVDEANLYIAMQEGGRGQIVAATSIIEGFLALSPDDLQEGKPIALVLVRARLGESRGRLTSYPHTANGPFKLVAFPGRYQVVDPSGRILVERGWKIQEGTESEKGARLTLDAIGGGPQTTTWNACFEYSNAKMKLPFCLEVTYSWSDQGNVR